MSETRVQGQSGVGTAIRRVVARLTGLPACVICGRGRASVGWVVDSFGRVHGRCEGCVDEVGPNRPPAKAV